MADATMIDTARVTGRRAPHFELFDDVLADVRSLMEAERRGRLRRLGNWSLGQMLGHLSESVRFAYEPPPVAVKAPAALRLLARMMKRRLLTKGLWPGRRIANVPGGAFGINEISSDEGLARLIRAYERLQTTPPTRPHPLLGRLSHEEAQQLHLRHAELHLSFMRGE